MQAAESKMVTLTEAEYQAIPRDYRGVWETERTDWPNWETERPRLMGKRTMMKDHALLIEGIGFRIVEEQTDGN